MSTVDDIEHFVVLMLENRSFDHILGSLAETKKVDGVLPNSAKANACFGRNYSQSPSAQRVFSEDPRHDLTDVLAQIDVDESGVPRMDGFVRNYAAAYPQLSVDQVGQVMDYFPLNGLPILHQLAAQFCVCDHWFSSLLGPT